MDFVLSARDIGKKYRIFKTPADRVREAFNPFGKIYHTDFWALKNVSFDLERGVTFGILGRNGSGKSTLLQILAGIMPPTTGGVATKARIAALLQLGAGYNPEFSGRQNVLMHSTILGMEEAETRRRLPLVEEFADIGQFFEMPMKTYSSGMFSRVAFAAAIHVDPDILIIDETLAVGDVTFQEKCFRKFSELQERGTSVILVSHDVNAVLHTCDGAMVLEQGERIYLGDPKSAVNHYHEILYNRAPRHVAEDSHDAAEIRWAETDNAIEAFCRNRSAQDIASRRASYNKNEARLGDGAAVLVDYLIVADDEIDPVLIKKGARIQIFLKVHFRQDVPFPVAGIGMTTVDGVFVYGTNSLLAQAEIAPARKGEVRVFRTEFENRLVGGTLFLNLGCSTVDGQDTVFFDVRRSIASLTFQVDHSATGLIDLGAMFEEVAPAETASGETEVGRR